MLTKVLYIFHIFWYKQLQHPIQSGTMPLPPQKFMLVLLMVGN